MSGDRYVSYVPRGRSGRTPQKDKLSVYGLVSYLVVEVAAREADKRIAHRVHFLAHDAILEEQRRPSGESNEWRGGEVEGGGWD